MNIAQGECPGQFSLDTCEKNSKFGEEMDRQVGSTPETEKFCGVFLSLLAMHRPPQMSEHV